MKSFIHYITEVSTTTPHRVGRGNKHGIKKHVYVGHGGDPYMSSLHYNDHRHETTYHFPHPDGKRHVTVKFEGKHDGSGKEPKTQDLSYGVHDQTPHIRRGHPTPAGRLNIKGGSSTITHTADIQSKVHSITKHHLKNTNADEIRWTSEKFAHEHPTDEKKLAGRTKIYKRQAAKSIKDHPDWEYSDNSEHSMRHRGAMTTHTLTRKVK